MKSNATTLFWLFLAAVVPWQIAFYAVPCPSFFNEFSAFCGFALVLIALLRSDGHLVLSRQTWALLCAPALLAVTMLLQLGFGLVHLPSFVIGQLFFLGCAVIVVWMAYQYSQSGRMVDFYDGWARVWVWGCWLGLATALAQYLVLPVWPHLVAPVTELGRISGNVRQPNHFATLMALGLPCVAWLLDRKKISLTGALLTVIAIAVVVVLTRSRTGVVEVIAMALWMVFSSVRKPLLGVATTLSMAVAFLLFTALSRANILELYGSNTVEISQLSSAISDSRWMLWQDTLALIAQNFWTGVGVGQLNFYRLLSDLPTNMKVLHVNAHMLPLQLAVEYGAPVAIVFTALVSWAFASSIRSCGKLGSVAAASIAVVAIHSMTEFPLWYAYILLPFALMWGILLGDAAMQHQHQVIESTASLKLQLYGPMAIVAGTLLSLAHYLPTVAVYVVQNPGDTLKEREVTASKAFIFKHWILYSGISGLSFDVVASNPELLSLLDTTGRFYMNDYSLAQYALSLAANNKLEHARRVLATLRRLESKNLPLLEAYSKSASNAAAVRLRAVISDPSPPLVSARDF